MLFGRFPAQEWSIDLIWSIPSVFRMTRRSLDMNYRIHRLPRDSTCTEATIARELVLQTNHQQGWYYSGSYKMDLMEKQHHWALWSMKNFKCISKSRYSTTGFSFYIYEKPVFWHLQSWLLTDWGVMDLLSNTSFDLKIPWVPPALQDSPSHHVFFLSHRDKASVPVSYS